MGLGKNLIQRPMVDCGVSTVLARQDPAAGRDKKVGRQSGMTTVAGVRLRREMTIPPAHRRRAGTRIGDRSHRSLHLAVQRPLRIGDQHERQRALIRHHRVGRRVEDRDLPEDGQLVLAALHGLEAMMWAAVYVWVGAFGSLSDALLYSVGTITTRGTPGLALPTRWQVMGALEAINGMLLFGISTAFRFSRCCRSPGRCCRAVRPRRPPN